MVTLRQKRMVVRLELEKEFEMTAKEMMDQKRRETMPSIEFDEEDRTLADPEAALLKQIADLTARCAELEDERDCANNALSITGRDKDALKKREAELHARLVKLEAGIAEHAAQKADDRCIEDDDRLYALVGAKCDRRVGDKAAMLANCARFIEQRCEGGGWPTYAELEAARDEFAAQRDRALASEARLREALARVSNVLRKRPNVMWLVSSRRTIDAALVSPSTAAEWLEARDAKARETCARHVEQMWLGSLPTERAKLAAELRALATKPEPR